MTKSKLEILFELASQATELALSAVADKEEKKQFCQEAIAYYRQILPYKTREDFCLEELAKLYLILENYAAARYYANNALYAIAVIAATTNILPLPQVERIVRMHLIIGDFERENNNLSQAISHYERAYEAASTYTPNKDCSLMAKERLAIACMLDFQDERAKTLFLEIMKEAKQAKDKAWGKRVGEECLRFFLSLKKQQQEQPLPH